MNEEEARAAISARLAGFPGTYWTQESPPPFRGDPVAVGGVWIAFYWDSSSVVPFASELEALRYAQGMSMQVKFAKFGDEDWMRN